MGKIYIYIDQALIPRQLHFVQLRQRRLQLSLDRVASGVHAPALDPQRIGGLRRVLNQKIDIGLAN